MSIKYPLDQEVKEIRRLLSVLGNFVWNHHVEDNFYFELNEDEQDYIIMLINKINNDIILDDYEKRKRIKYLKSLI